VFLQEEKLDAAESAAPSAADVEALTLPEDQLECVWVRFSVWAEYGYYDKVRLFVGVNIALIVYLTSVLCCIVLSNTSKGEYISVLHSSHLLVFLSGIFLGCIVRCSHTPKKVVICGHCIAHNLSFILFFFPLQGGGGTAVSASAGGGG
jgi:hypothetical protein